MRASALAGALALVLGTGCQPDSAPPAASSAPVSAARAPARIPSARSKRPERPPSRARPAPPRLVSLRLGPDRRYLGQLGPDERSVRAVVATKQRPLGPRGPAAQHAVAALVAPEVVGETELRALPLRELLGAAADERTRQALGKELRVLSDGGVLAALIALPAKPGTPVDLGDNVPGRRAFVWESKLAAKEPPDAGERRLLAAYQKLIALDYLVDNRVRRRVLVDERAGTLVAIDDNDAFSPRYDDRGVGDPMRRLSSHVVFSKSLRDRLGKLERAAIERALRAGPEASLLVTPKQLDELLDRKASLERLIDSRVRTRGGERVLLLP